MTVFYSFTKALCQGLFRLCYHHRVYGLEHLYHSGAIIAANHVSFLDPPLLGVSWPKTLVFLAHERLFSRCLLGSVIRHLNAHPVSGHASDIATLKTIGALIQEGKQVVIFPEGTRSETEGLAPLKCGVAMIALRYHCAIIPTYIDGSGEAWGRQHRFPRLVGRTACVFGSPIDWQAVASLPKKEAQQALTAQLTQSIESLRLWYRQGAQGTPP